MLIPILNLVNKWRCVRLALLFRSFSPGSLGPADLMDVPKRDNFLCSGRDSIGDVRVAQFTTNSF